LKLLVCFLNEHKEKARAPRTNTRHLNPSPDSDRAPPTAGGGDPPFPLRPVIETATPELPIGPPKDLIDKVAALERSNGRAASGGS
jgi:hypothetical protein